MENRADLAHTKRLFLQQLRRVLEKAVRQMDWCSEMGYEIVDANSTAGFEKSGH